MGASTGTATATATGTGMGIPRVRMLTHLNADEEFGEPPAVEAVQARLRTERALQWHPHLGGLDLLVDLATGERLLVEYRFRELRDRGQPEICALGWADAQQSSQLRWIELALLVGGHCLLSQLTLPTWGHERDDAADAPKHRTRARAPPLPCVGDLLAQRSGDVVGTGCRRSCTARVSCDVWRGGCGGGGGGELATSSLIGAASAGGGKYSALARSPRAKRRSNHGVSLMTRSPPLSSVARSQSSSWSSRRCEASLSVSWTSNLNR